MGLKPLINFNLKPKGKKGFGGGTGFQGERAPAIEKGPFRGPPGAPKKGGPRAPKTGAPGGPNPKREGGKRAPSARGGGEEAQRGEGRPPPGEGGAPKRKRKRERREAEKGGKIFGPFWKKKGGILDFFLKFLQVFLFNKISC